MSLKKELENYMDGLDIIDTHEHLPMSHECRKRSTDFFREYDSYLAGDLILAGLDVNVYLEQVLNPALSVMEKWNLVEPYWEKCRFTGYAQFVDETVRELYGIPGINRDTVENVERCFQDSLAMNWHEEVLKKRCHIKTALLNTPHNWVGIEHMEESFQQTDRRYFSPVADIVPYIGLYSRKSLSELEHSYGRSITGLEDLRDACEGYLYRAAESGVAGFKSNLAYNRSLAYDRATFAEAEKCFMQILSGEDEETRDGWHSTDTALENYMMHFALSVIEELKLPFQIHTGLNGGPVWGNILAESNPELLIPLFIQYPGVQFDLFHMGFPYQNMLGALGHMYGNVHIDMCWGHIISPAASVSCLSELLEAIPYNKILGFGGDVPFLDGVAGNRRIAIKNIAAALAEKIEDGLFSEKKACEIAKALLYDNPAELYRIEG